MIPWSCADTLIAVQASARPWWPHQRIRASRLKAQVRADGRVPEPHKLRLHHRGACPFTGLEPLYPLIIVGGAAGVAAVALLTRSLRRPAGRQPRWHLAFVLLAAAMPCIAAASGPRYAYGPGYGTATGIVTRCSAAEMRAGGWGPETSRFAIVSAQDQAGKIVATQRLPLRASGARYRMRLLAGTYSINVSPQSGDGPNFGDDWEYVPADAADEQDFNEPLSCV